MMNYKIWAIAGALLYTGVVFSAEDELSVYFKNMSDKDVSVWIGASSGKATSALKRLALKSQREPFYLGEIQEGQSFFYSYQGYAPRSHVYQEPFETFSAHKNGVLLELLTVPSGMNWKFDIKIHQADKYQGEDLPVSVQPILALTRVIIGNMQKGEAIDPRAFTDFPQIFITAGVDKGKVDNLVTSLKNYDQLIASKLYEKIHSAEEEGHVETSKQLKLLLETVRSQVRENIREIMKMF